MILHLITRSSWMMIIHLRKIQTHQTLLALASATKSLFVESSTFSSSMFSYPLGCETYPKFLTQALNLRHFTLNSFYLPIKKLRLSTFPAWTLDALASTWNLSRFTSLTHRFICSISKNYSNESSIKRSSGNSEQNSNQMNNTTTRLKTNNQQKKST